jgi:hypothetical protein
MPLPLLESFFKLLTTLTASILGCKERRSRALLPALLPAAGNRGELGGGAICIGISNLLIPSIPVGFGPAVVAAKRGGFEPEI